MTAFTWQVLSFSKWDQNTNSGTWDEQSDNIDIQIELDNGDRYWGTFFTIDGIESLFKKNRETGECRSGTYLWATNMIILRRLDQETITSTIAGLLEEQELAHALFKVEQQA